MNNDGFLSFCLVVVSTCLLVSCNTDEVVTPPMIQHAELLCSGNAGLAHIHTDLRVVKQDPVGWVHVKCVNDARFKFWSPIK